MATSISSLIIACLKSFNEFIEETGRFQEENVGGLAASAWKDELGRLRMWAANIGAHQTGQSSLDFRLRDASHVREQIIKLLQSLLRRLQDARDVMAEDEGSDDDDVAEDLMDEEDPKTEIQELLESLATIINCLFQMSMLVRKPAQHDVIVGSKRADVAAFEPFDYNHVREKYPRADDPLVKRLGNAITRRRKYLRYRERHAMKLRQGIDAVDPGARDFQHVREGEREGIASILSDTVATDFQHGNIEFDDNTSDTDVSQTSYAPTLLSGGNVTIPPPPKSSLGGVPFECPFCFYLITTRGTRSWNKHVFQDLQPYICVAPTCTTPDKLYATRHEWLHHSNTAHPVKLMDHSTHEESKDFAACPLCKEEVDSGNQYDRHLARHLLELALFILPRSEEDSDDSDNQDAESTSSAESVDFVASHGRSKSPDGLPASPVEHLAAVRNPTSPYSKQRQDEEKKLRIQLRERQTELGPEHPDTLTSMADLGSIYEEQGKLADAETMYQRALEGYEETYNPDHNLTLNVVRNLGIVFEKQGKLADAETMYQRALEGYEKTYSPDHNLTLNIVRNLGIVYEKQGKLADAETMYQRALEGYEETYSPDHNLTLNVARNLGIVYEKQGKLAEAKALNQRALNGYENILGPDGKPGKPEKAKKLR
ncbi:MAG: hypothetical protein ALECFALPRED_001699 [Alectoria fallacina]|uniref:Oxidoreductase acuF-like C2H2 type zinc-finger domain-containing protein n=1 Tax=Alectoria fallacina TaxID=1903189 RepID=A0A8H3IAL6_9LECA|nr:MAG: hypothetical protein ALECFALPRED_001699 [Alectoria fallacina]